jgi:hypothetical protein
VCKLLKPGKHRKPLQRFSAHAGRFVTSEM